MQNAKNLVLERCVGDEVVITHGGEQLIVYPVSVRNGAVRLGFKGPLSFVIHRAEVQHEIDEQRIKYHGTGETA